MKRQYNLIHKMDWDTLVVLDACRYDTFRDIYKEHLTHNCRLECVDSECKDTISWLKKTWHGKYDIVYYSAHPYVNSKSEFKGWRASEHFTRIVDIWKDGWNERLSTVEPRVVNDFVIRDMSPKRKVIHYVQPHAPYIGETMFVVTYRPHRLGVGLMVAELIKRKYIPHDFIVDAYVDNLRLVLDSVNELLGHLKGKTIITSDHGECLGEEGYYIHGGDRPDIIRKVPWCEIEC